MRRLRESHAALRPHLPSSCLLLAYTLALFWPIPFSSRFTLASQDILNQFYPWTEFWVREFRTNGFPLWNPYAFCGSPFIGNLQAAIFYPPQFLLPLLSPLLFFGWTLCLHTLLAGAGMYALVYFLTRNRVSSCTLGLAWMSGGFLATRIDAGHVTILNALPWAPLVILFYLRWIARPGWGRWTAMAAVMAIQLLGGQPQIPYLTFFLVGLLALGECWNYNRADKRPLDRALWPLGGALAAMAVAVVLTAVYWLPCHEFNQLSITRSDGLSFEEAAWGSLPPDQLLHAALPFLFGDPMGREFWGATGGAAYQEICVFLGLGVLLFLPLAFMGTNAPRQRLWGGILALSLLLALGKFTPLYRLAYWFVPGIRFVRVPARFLLPASMALSVLAGYGLKFWLEGGWNRKRMRGVALAAAGGVFLLLLGAWLIVNLNAETIQGMLSRTQVPVNTPNYSPRQLMLDRWGDLERSLRWGMLFSGLWLGWFAMSVWKGNLWKVVAGSLLALVLFESGWFAHRFIRPRETQDVLQREYGEIEAIRYLEEHCSLDRVLRPDSMIGWWTRKQFPQCYPNRLMVHGVQTCRGYDVSIPVDYALFIYAMQGREVPEAPGFYLHFGEPGQLSSRMLSLLNVRYLLLPYREPIPGFHILSEGPPWVYEYERAFPRAYILPPDLAIPGQIPEDASAEVTLYTPNEIRIEAVLPRAGWLVVADNYYPGWKAESGGQALEIEKVLGTFRGIRLEPGQHEIWMIFSPGSLWRGAWISGAGLLGLIAVNLVWFCRKVGRVGHCPP